MRIKINREELINATNPMWRLDRLVSGGYGKDYKDMSERVKAHFRRGFAIACWEKRVDVTKPHKITEKKGIKGNIILEIEQNKKYLFPKKEVA